MSKNGSRKLAYAVSIVSLAGFLFVIIRFIFAVGEVKNDYETTKKITYENKECVKVLETKFTEHEKRQVRMETYFELRDPHNWRIAALRADSLAADSIR